MNRRDLILGGAAVALTASTAQASDHAGHDMAGHDMHAMEANKYAALIKSAADCQVTGDACVAHCLTAIQGGDTTLAACLRSVTEMQALCAATMKLAALDAASAPKLIALCAEVCEACEKECRKHEKHHATCKACAESCATCVKECKKALKAA